MIKIISILIVFFIIGSFWFIEKRANIRFEQDQVADISAKRKTAAFIYWNTFQKFPRGHAVNKNKMGGRVRRDPTIPLWRMPGGRGEQIINIPETALLAIIQERQITKDNFFSETGLWYEVAYLKEANVYRGWISAENVEKKSS